MKYSKCKMANCETGIPKLEHSKFEVIQQNIEDISARSQIGNKHFWTQTTVQIQGRDYKEQWLGVFFMLFIRKQMSNAMFWVTSSRKHNQTGKCRSALSSGFEIWIKVVCAMEASVSSTLLLLLEGICFVFHWDTAKLLSAINLQWVFLGKWKT